ncbi:MAG: agarase [Phycisphaerales bacterium]|nr:agarase [Phycisphaerales bacterium]
MRLHAAAVTRVCLLPMALLVCSTIAVCSAAPSSSAGNYVTVKNIAGRWWLISPHGHRFISRGVDAVNAIAKISRKLGSAAQQRRWAAAHFAAWGFNTLGAWSAPAFAAANPGAKPLYQTPVLNLGAAYVAKIQHGRNAWLGGVFPDVFDREFQKIADKTARRLTARFAHNHRVIGYFSDNELHWGPDWRGDTELLMAFLHEPPAAPGHIRAVAFLEKRYPSVRTFNRIWHEHLSCICHLMGENNIRAPYRRRPIYSRNPRHEALLDKANPGRARFFSDCDAFAQIVAARYLRICRAAIKQAAPHQLYLGCRFAYFPGRAIAAEAAKYADVISLNCYDLNPTSVLQRYAPLNKPLMITEFSFRARDSGLPNTKGAGVLVNTQAQRAADAVAYIKACLAFGQVVGYHWFEYADEPKAGRFDGENSNYGLVRRSARPYATLTRELTQVNAQAVHLHELGR